MSSPSFESVVKSLASVCPLGGLADSLQGRFSGVLSSSRLYLSPLLYSRFSVSLLVYAGVFEVLALFLPRPQAFIVLAAVALVQAAPILVPVTMSYSRRRGVEAELPFFLIVLSIFSRASSPSIDDGLRRSANLGDGVFPELRKEQAIVERDLTFRPGSPASIVEATLGSHPSPKLREFVRSFMITLTTGKSVSEFVEEEAKRQVRLLESRWRGFSESVGSLAEVSLMVLALFPVGLDMLAAAVPGLATSQILAFALAVLAVFSAGLLVLLDSAQPLQHNSAPRVLPLVMTVLSWSASTYLYIRGSIPITVALAVPLSVSTLGFLQTRRLHSMITKGEDEAGILLHALAEQSKAGVSLPEALESASRGSPAFLSIREPVAAFHRSIMLGSRPEEAQKKVTHPSWLVRLSFGMLAVALETGAGYEQLESLSSFFRRLSDARRDAARSLLPFIAVGVIVPSISIASMSFLSTFNQGGVPFLPSFTAVSKSYILLSISAVSLLTGIILSKLFAQTSKHALMIPPLLASTILSLLIFGIH